MTMNILLFDSLPSTVNVHLSEFHDIRPKKTSESMYCYLIPWVYLIHPFSMILILPSIDMYLANWRIDYIILNKLVLKSGPDYRRSLGRDNCNFKPRVA